MRRLLSALATLLVATALWAQTEAPKTPFPYPVAPDTCTTLESRCDYILQHFWDNYDITRPITDEQAFETAFRDFVTFFRYANRNIVMSTIRDFMFKARSNSANLLKIGAVAERALYSTTAEFWSDEVYVEFARALADNKTLKKDVRQYYAEQIARINQNQIGAVIADIEYYDADGKKVRISDIPGEGYFILFTDKGIDSSIARARLSADVNINALADGGKIVVVNILLADYERSWADGMPKNWVNLCSNRAAGQFDLREVPCCYIIDKERRLLQKNINIDQLKSVF